MPPLSDWAWSEADKEDALVFLGQKRHVIEALPEGPSAVMLQAHDDVIVAVERSLAGVGFDVLLHEVIESGEGKRDPTSAHRASCSGRLRERP